MTLNDTDLAWAQRMIADATATERLVRSYPLLEDVSCHAGWLHEFLIDGRSFRAIELRHGLPRDYAGHMIERLINKYRRMVLDEQGKTSDGASVPPIRSRTLR